MRYEHLIICIPTVASSPEIHVYAGESSRCVGHSLLIIRTCVVANLVLSVGRGPHCFEKVSVQGWRLVWLDGMHLSTRRHSWQERVYWRYSLRVHLDGLLVGHFVKLIGRKSGHLQCH